MHRRKYFDKVIFKIDCKEITKEKAINIINSRIYVIDTNQLNTQKLKINGK
ncbi:MAG: hypothetical protein PHP92_05135 [Candidatus Nanoarchaeia archaeon]|nr:hypothetical protein [Candidatus Nanoarchaeia archaeon]